MNKTIEQVKEFHETFNHPVGDLTVLEPLATRQLRIKLIFEELQELAEASNCMKTLYLLCTKLTDDCDEDNPEDGDNVNQLEELDALCDIQYVLNGKILTAGMQEIFDKNFELVHSNNMSKAHTDEAHALQTIDKSQSTLGFHKQGEYYIVTNKDGKIIKPWDHQKVALSLT